MFTSCSGLTQLDVTGFDTAQVISIPNMFSGCSGLTQLDVTGFDTARVTSMAGLFKSCSGLTQLDLSSFDTAKVTSMAYMFNGCTNLNSIQVPLFSAAALTNALDMLRNCPAALQPSYEQILIRFAATIPGTGPAVTLDAPNIPYRRVPVPAANAHNKLTNPPNFWVITDAGPV